jgi:transcriptional antiterminator RfaH
MTNAWFCLKSHPKHEHIAAAQLRQWEDVEIFCPRIRFRRKVRSGAMWTTEALFPGYLFARFEPEALLCRVRSARGVSGIVRFGDKYPLVPDETIAELQRSMGPCETATVTPAMEPGMAATVASGPLSGLRCVIHHVLPVRERVAVLLNLLGQITLVELKEGDIVVRPLHPLAEAL